MNHRRADQHGVRSVAEHGEGHLVTVVRRIRETSGNGQKLWSEAVLAVSTRTPRVQTGARRAGALFEAFDAIPLASPRGTAVALRPWPVRHTLRGFIYAALRDRLGITDEVQLSLAA